MLPIEAVIPDILQAVAGHDRVVIQAPPGAGKTTVIPLALLGVPEIAGKILLIQPRRLAVYGAARFMASKLGEAAGQTVGYRTRFDSRCNRATRIEVITEGIFLRQIQEDPTLEGISAVIFDEFHERSVNIDLGLAFALDAQRGLREEADALRILVMSATLDGSGLSAWLQCPMIASEGRCYPVVTRYSPAPAGTWPDQHVAQVISRLLREEDGNILVFLPGFREMHRVSAQLSDIGLPQEVQLHLLHASLPPDAQEQAISAPPPGQRKVVLSTNVAETSVTIEGIRVVIDSGQARVAAYDERRGLDVLQTQRISAASAEQRRGRAGRLMPGVCVRLWSESESLKPFTDPEIIQADLLPIALELALWGVSDPTQLALLTPPAPEALMRARSVLQALDALDAQGRVTALGKQLASLGLPPRLAQLVWLHRQQPVASAAMATAMILSEGDPLRSDGNTQADLHARLMLWSQGSRDHQLQRGIWQRIQQGVKQLAERIKTQWRPQAVDDPAIAAALAQAFPDRVAQVRADHKQRYLMANGRGAQLAREDRLAGSPLLVVLDTDGAGTEPRIRLAVAITPAALETALASHLSQQTVVQWNSQRRAVEVEQQKRLGSLILQRRAMKQPWPESAQTCLIDAVREDFSGLLPWDEEARQLQARVNWLHQQFPERWPDYSDETLRVELEEWLTPYLDSVYSANDLSRLSLAQMLKAYLSWPLPQQLDSEAPANWSLPTGSAPTLDYTVENGPVLRARMQEFYGLREHPTLPGGQSLLVELLSPAHRPLQITRDLPGFWKGSYKEVAKEMRGRYPKHFWPENPSDAQATTRTKAKM